ncbi:MAG: NfeD family protein [Brachymonas sp.]|nr:NfeD family protein [Brachymonas sp.]
MVDSATVWWVVMAALIGAELLTGTFYLLMLALGAAAGAIAAHLNAGVNGQIAVAAIVGTLTTVAWHIKRMRAPKDAHASANRNVNLDIGETVQVDAWLPDGTAQVRYRGAPWTVEAAPGTLPEPGMHRVRAVVANRLVVEKI